MSYSTRRCQVISVIAFIISVVLATIVYFTTRRPSISSIVETISTTTLPPTNYPSTGSITYLPTESLFLSPRSSNSSVYSSSYDNETILTTFSTTAPTFTVTYVTDTEPTSLDVTMHPSSQPTNDSVKTTSHPTQTPTALPTHTSAIPSVNTTKAYQLIPIGKPIMGFDESLFGYSLSLSQNAKKVSIGSPLHDLTHKNTGVAKVYQNSNNTTNNNTTNNDNTNNDTNWTPMNFIFGNTPNEWIGWTVPLSSNGKYLAVNGRINSSPHVTIYRDDNGVWTQRGAAITHSRIGFGISLSLSNDGSRLAIGARRFACVYQFDEGSDTWMVIGDVAEEAKEVFVAISGDGRRFAVGCPEDDSRLMNAGRVRVFEFGEFGLLVGMGQFLYGSRLGDMFGYSLALSNDGEEMAVGTFSANYVRMFHFSDEDSVWVPHGDLVGGKGRINDADEKFGFSLSLSGDGNRLVVGSCLYGKQRGKAVIFQRGLHGRWEEIIDVLGEERNDQEGYAVSMSLDGDYVAVASLYHGDYDNGRVRVFRIVSPTAD